MLTFELKLLADVGLVGLPNAGKSTLLSKVSSATPKIASYPFTTLSPGLGVVYDDPHGQSPVVWADLPGLVEGAHKGVGLGLRFLKHVERVGVIVYVLDATERPADALEVLRHEIAAYAPAMLTRPSVVVFNKCDGRVRATPRRSEKIKLKIPSVRCSAIRGEGISALVRKVHALARAAGPTKAEMLAAAGALLLPHRRES